MAEKPVAPNLPDDLIMPAPAPLDPAPVSGPADDPVDVLVRPAPSPTAPSSAAPASASPSTAVARALEDAHPEDPEGWPAWVPSSDVAQRCLASLLTESPDPEPDFLDTTRAVAAKLSPLERGALLDEIESVEASRTLRRSAALRWRLAAAIATVPPRGETRDSAALETLTREGEQVIDALATLAAASASPDLAKAIESLRDELTHQTVDFVPSLAAAEAAAIARPAQRRVRKPAAAKATATAPNASAWKPSAEGSSSRRALQVAALVVAVGLGGVLISLQGSHLTMTPVAGAPAGIVGVESPDNSVILAQRPAASAARAPFDAWLTTKTAEGWTASERPPSGCGMFMLVRTH